MFISECRCYSLLKFSDFSLLQKQSLGRVVEYSYSGNLKKEKQQRQQNCLKSKQNPWKLPMKDFFISPRGIFKDFAQVSSTLFSQYSSRWLFPLLAHVPFRGLTSTKILSTISERLFKNFSLQDISIGFKIVS